MSYSYGATSQARLDTCHADLRRVLKEAIKHRDITILCGHRNKVDQDAAHASGASTKTWPNSKHNRYPSLAVDAAPWPLTTAHWKDREHWVAWGNWLIGFAAGMGVKLRWGGDWDMNWSSKDEKFFDGPHFELMEE